MQRSDHTLQAYVHGGDLGKEPHHSHRKDLQRHVQAHRRGRREEGHQRGRDQGQAPVPDRKARVAASQRIHPNRPPRRREGPAPRRMEVRRRVHRRILARQRRQGLRHDHRWKGQNLLIPNSQTFYQTS